jgi:CheY-like chemotaxis protein
MTPPSDITIEVVDDDKDLRNTLVMVLRAQGFKVRAHHSGTAYLSAERSQGNSFDAAGRSNAFHVRLEVACRNTAHGRHGPRDFHER